MRSTSLGRTSGRASDRHRHSRTCGRRGSDLGPRVRGVLGAAFVVPVLALSLVACSGGSDGGDGGGGKSKDGQGQGGSDTSGGSSGGEGGGSAAPLSEKQLKSALLKSGDVKGYRAQRDEEALPQQNSVTADDPRCSAITDAVDSEPEHARTAHASGVLLKGGLGGGGALQQVLLSSYAEGGAGKWLGDLKKALKECDAFTGKVGSGQKTKLRIEPGEGVGVGDDSVQFTMRGSGQNAGGGSGETGSPTVFTIVRAGGSTASFMSVSLSGKPQAVEKALVEKQYEKLSAAAGE